MKLLMGVSSKEVPEPFYTEENDPIFNFKEESFTRAISYTMECVIKRFPKETMGILISYLKLFYTNADYQRPDLFNSLCIAIGLFSKLYPTERKSMFDILQIEKSIQFSLDHQFHIRLCGFLSYFLEFFESKIFKVNY